MNDVVPFRAVTIERLQLDAANMEIKRLRSAASLAANEMDEAINHMIAALDEMRAIRTGFSNFMRAPAATITPLKPGMTPRSDGTD